MFNFDGISRLQEVDVERKRVFVRADLDAFSSASGELQDTTQVGYAAPTLRWLLNAGAQVVVGAQRGPLTGKADERWSLEPCGALLAELLGAEVFLPEESSGPLVQKLLNELKAGSLVLLENLAFNPGEIQGETAFALDLSNKIDLYVADCLAAPANLASLAELPRLCRDRTLGLRAESELLAANRLMQCASEQRVLVLGGSFNAQADWLSWALRPGQTLIAGGDLANTLLSASGVQLKATAVAAETLPAARAWLSRAKNMGVKVLLPKDARVADKVVRSGEQVRDVKELSRDERILDVGPATLEQSRSALQNAKSVVFAGHMGSDLTQNAGTIELLKAVASSNAYSLVSLEGVAKAVQELGAEARTGFGFVSTAGSLLPSMLSSKRIPHVECLRSN